jgi:hypothetical protein
LFLRRNIDDRLITLVCKYDFRDKLSCNADEDQARIGYTGNFTIVVGLIIMMRACFAVH